MYNFHLGIGKKYKIFYLLDVRIKQKTSFFVLLLSSLLTSTSLDRWPDRCSQHRPILTNDKNDNNGKLTLQLRTFRTTTTIVIVMAVCGVCAIMDDLWSHWHQTLQQIMRPSVIHNGIGWQTNKTKMCVKSNKQNRKHK